MAQKIKLNKQDLKLLNSEVGLRYLFADDPPNLKKSLAQLRYKQELEKLQTQLIKVQNWVVSNNERIIIIIEGREFAGKGGAIRNMVEHLNPRSIRVVALPKPSEKEMGQWYFQRYINELPEGGEMVFFDRSWYNRAVVEPVNGFCTKKEYEQFINEVPFFEQMLINDGIKIVKFYISINKRTQEKRIEKIRSNPLRRWELTPVDEMAVSLWDTYTKYKNKMFKITSTDYSPWIILRGDDSKKVRLEAIKYLISKFPKVSN